MNQIASIRVHYKHVDGWHVFTSTDIPGLYVASEDPERAYNDVGPSVQKLLELNEGIKCEISPVVPFMEFLRGLRSAARHQPKTPAPPFSLSNQNFLVSACA